MRLPVCLVANIAKLTRCTAKGVPANRQPTRQNQAAMGLKNCVNCYRSMQRERIPHHNIHILFNTDSRGRTSPPFMRRNSNFAHNSLIFITIRAIFEHLYNLLSFTYLTSSKIQAIYFETSALYFQICALYFSRSALCFFACVHMQFYATGNKHVFVRSRGEKSAVTERCFLWSGKKVWCII